MLRCGHIHRQWLAFIAALQPGHATGHPAQQTRQQTQQQTREQTQAQTKEPLQQQTRQQTQQQTRAPAQQQTKEQMQQVKTGIQDGAFIQVTEGLAEGDKVVAKAGVFVRDGDRINPVDETSSVSN